MKKLFILFLLCCCGSASADTMYYVAKIENGLYGSQASACQAHGARLNGLGGDYTYKFNSVGSGGGCLFNMIYKDGTDFGISGSGSATPYTVPSCSEGQVHQEGPGGGGCVTPPKAPCSTPAGGAVSWTQKTGHSASADAEQGDGPPGPIPTSSPTCGVSDAKPTNCWSVPAAGGGQDFFCKFSGTSTGQDAPSSAPNDAGSQPSGSKPTNAPPTKADPSGKCPGGMTQGGVSPDGMAICVGSGTNPVGANGGAPTDARPTASTTTKTTDASGNKVTTTTGTRDNGDGSKTTTKTVETEAPDGSKSSTTTTTTGLTPGGKQGQPDKPDNDFCRVHPELNICRNSSIAGQCGQITCMGDAIQCATLRAAAAMQCAQEKDVEAVKQMPAKALGDQMLAGADPMKGEIDAAIKGREVDLGAASLDQSGFLGGGSCLADRSFVVMGKTVTMSFSSVCERIQPLRAAVMACAFIVAYLLVARSVLNS